MRSSTESFPRVFWILWVGTLINRLGLVVLPFLTLFLTQEREMTVERATLLLGMHGAGQFFAAFVGGVLADRVGRKPVLIASLVGGAVSMACIPFAPSALAIGLAVLSAGFLGEMYRPAVAAAITDIVPAADRARAFALMYWAINLGAAAAPIVGGVLAERSYKLLFLLDAATMLGYALVVTFGIRETLPASVASDLDSPVLPPFSALRTALTDPLLMGLTFCMLLVGTTFLQGYSTLPVVLGEAGFRPSEFGMVISLNGVIIVLLSLPVSRWAARQAPGLLLAGAVALIGVGMWSHGLASTLGGYAVGVAIWTLGEIAFLPVLPSYIAQLAPDEARGTYQGVYGAGWGLAHSVGPIAGGFVLGQFGPQTLWFACLLVALLASFTILALRPALRRRIVPGV